MFRSYVDLVPAGDVLARLSDQGGSARALFGGLDEARGNHAYAAGKWTVKRLLQHLADGERLFCYRAMCIARGDATPLPGFDEDVYAQHDGTEGPLPA